jgi:predicted alpha/beta superfamily hydrolase
MQVLARTKSDFCANTEVWHVRSTHVDDELRVCITAPAKPIPREAPIGVVYAMDAPLLAGTLVDTINAGTHSGELPQLYAVSVGYPLDRGMSHFLRRARDLTPTALPAFDQVLPLLLGESRVVSSGAADAFLSFLLDELRPALELAFSIDPAAATLTGTSLGGLFALHAVLSNPAAFRRYLPISPSIWWDNRLLLARVKQQVGSARAPLADVYLCAGDLEDAQRLRAHFDTLPAQIRAVIPPDMLNADILADMQALTSAFAPWCGSRFRIRAHVYPEESHASIIGQALSRGLRALYGTRPW